MYLKHNVFKVSARTMRDLDKLLRRIGGDKATGILQVKFSHGGICDDPEWTEPARLQKGQLSKTS